MGYGQPEDLYLSVTADNGMTAKGCLDLRGGYENTMDKQVVLDALDRIKELEHEKELLQEFIRTGIRLYAELMTENGRLQDQIDEESW